MVKVMNDMKLSKVPVAKTGMLIRRPVQVVFEAIVDPAITSQFWFSKGEGRLEVGKPVRWTWESHDISIDVDVKSVEPDRKIVIEWPGYSGPTRVEWTFQALPDSTTFVRVMESGWTGNADLLARYVADSTQGFTLMLTGLKALLEHGIRLNLTTDHCPKGIEDQAIGA
jgi:uncharacterized protein YndB with AHSA1/START domain